MFFFYVFFRFLFLDIFGFVGVKSVIIYKLYVEIILEYCIYSIYLNMLYWGFNKDLVIYFFMCVWI